MDIDRIRDYLLERSRMKRVSGVARELHVADSERRIVVVIGPRRAGKTFFFGELMEDGAESLYLNFEDTRLLDVKYDEIRDVIRLSVEMVGIEPKRLFFDEIQNIEHWESAVRELLDLNRYKIYVTGSSSKLLGKDIATQLRGRSLTYILLPFSFREFLASKGVDYENRMTKDETAKVKKIFREYMEWGGFPEIALGVAERERILRDYFEMILFKDVVERYGIKNIALARFVLVNLLQNFTKEVSVNKIAELAGKTEGSRVTVYDYFNKVQDSAAVFFTNRFSARAHVRESWPKKVYICDNGLAKAAKFSEDIGKLMENLVFLELLRATNRHPLTETYFWKETAGEVDFVVKDGSQVRALIQVTYASKAEEVADREVRSLLAASKATGCNNLKVLTWDFSGKKDADGKTIIFEPLWRWLLGAA